MSLIQNGGSYLMYQCASAKLAKWRRTGTIQGHGQAYFKVRSVTMFPNATWSSREGKASQSLLRRFIFSYHMAGNLVGSLFIIAVQRSIRQYFIRQKLYSVMSSLLQNHNFYVYQLQLYRRASLILGIEITIESCVRGHHFSRVLCIGGGGRVGLSVNARKTI